MCRSTPQVKAWQKCLEALKKKVEVQQGVCLLQRGMAKVRFGHASYAFGLRCILLWVCMGVINVVFVLGTPLPFLLSPFFFFSSPRLLCHHQFFVFLFPSFILFYSLGKLRYFLFSSFIFVLLGYLFIYLFIVFRLNWDHFLIPMCLHFFHFLTFHIPFFPKWKIVKLYK